jgi:hypothetical protein
MRDALERRAKVVLLALVAHQGRRQQHLSRAADQGLGEIHDVVAVGVRLVQLEHRELGIVLRRQSLVTEVAVDLVAPLETPDDEAA